MELNLFRPRILLKNWHLKKTNNATLNGYISKARANSESKPTFSESSFNFLQKRVVFCTSTHIDTRQGALPPTTIGAARLAQRIKISKDKEPSSSTAQSLAPKKFPAT